MNKNLFRMIVGAFVALAVTACREDEADIKSKATFSFNVESLEIASATNSRGEVTVTTNSDDFVVVIPDAVSWLTHVKEGKTVRFVSVIENPSFDTPRSVTVRFRGAGLNTSGGAAPFVVTQLPQLHMVGFTFAPASMEVFAKLAGDEKTVEVTTNPESTFSVEIDEEGQNWLIYSIEDNKVTFTTTADNNTEADRTATITFATTSDEVKYSTDTYTVTQTWKPIAAFESFAPTSLNVTNEVGSSGEVTVTTNTNNFTVTIDPSATWLTQSKADNVVTFTVAEPNLDVENTRTATVTFTATGDNTVNDNVTATYSVVQAVGIQTFELTGTEVSVGGAAGSSIEAPFVTNVTGTVTVDNNGSTWFTAAYDPVTKKVTVTCAAANDEQEQLTGGVLTITPPAGSGFSPINIAVKQRVHTYLRKIYNRNGVLGIIFWIDPANDQNVKILHPQFAGNSNSTIALGADAAFMETRESYYWAATGSTSVTGTSGNSNATITRDGVMYYGNMWFKYKGGDGTALSLDALAIPNADSDDGEVNVAAIKAFASTLEQYDDATNKMYGTDAFIYYFYAHACDVKDTGTEPTGHKWYVPSITELQTLFCTAWNWSGTFEEAPTGTWGDMANTSTYEYNAGGTSVTDPDGIDTWIETNASTFWDGKNVEAFQYLRHLMMKLGGRSLLYRGAHTNTSIISSTQNPSSNSQMLAVSFGEKRKRTYEGKSANGRQGRCIKKATYDEVYTTPPVALPADLPTPPESLNP